MASTINYDAECPSLLANLSRTCGQGEGGPGRWSLKIRGRLGFEYRPNQILLNIDFSCLAFDSVSSVFVL